jgi:hypothetical protein
MVHVLENASAQLHLGRNQVIAFLITHKTRNALVHPPNNTVE